MVRKWALYNEILRPMAQLAPPPWDIPPSTEKISPKSIIQFPELQPVGLLPRNVIFHRFNVQLELLTGSVIK